MSEHYLVIIPEDYPPNHAPKCCIVPNCKGKHVAKGLCSGHRGRWKKAGRPKRWKASKQPIKDQRPKIYNPYGWFVYEVPGKFKHDQAPNRCLIPDCKHPHFKRGLCKKHHYYWVRHAGKPNRWVVKPEHMRVAA